MSRYVRDIQTSKSPAEVEVAVTSYLHREGFTQERYKGEEVWEKGIGLMLGPQFVKVTPEDGNVHLEAWIKGVLLPGLYVGEMGTEGLMGAIPKRKLKERVAELESLIA
jgi:hypothetical protein